MIEINKLIPTHNKIRDPKGVAGFIDWIEEGRIFRGPRFKPITLVWFGCSRVWDGQSLYIRDGHRRITAAYKCGLRELLDVEYVIDGGHGMGYWRKANPINGWLTPFDPQTECRLPDFFAYKDSIYNKYGCGPNRRELDNWRELMDEISARSAEYKEPRKISTVKELAQCV